LIIVPVTFGHGWDAVSLFADANLTESFGSGKAPRIGTQHCAEWGGWKTGSARPER